MGRVEGSGGGGFNQILASPSQPAIDWPRVSCTGLWRTLPDPCPRGAGFIFLSPGLPPQPSCWLFIDLTPCHCDGCWGPCPPRPPWDAGSMPHRSSPGVHQDALKHCEIEMKKRGHLPFRPLTTALGVSPPKGKHPDGAAGLCPQGKGSGQLLRLQAHKVIMWKLLAPALICIWHHVSPGSPGHAD